MHWKGHNMPEISPLCFSTRTMLLLRHVSHGLNDSHCWLRSCACHLPRRQPQRCSSSRSSLSRRCQQRPKANSSLPSPLKHWRVLAARVRTADVAQVSSELHLQGFLHATCAVLVLWMCIVTTCLPQHPGVFAVDPRLRLHSRPWQLVTPQAQDWSRQGHNLLQAFTGAGLLQIQAGI